MKMVRRVSSPYNVNAAALACLPAAIADAEYLTNYVAEAVESRRRLEAFFANENIRYWPSRANFVLAKLAELRISFVEAMKRRGILVRDRNSDYGCEGCVRITAGTPSQADILLSAMEEVVRELRVGELR